MNPQMMQAIMQLLGGQGEQGQPGGMGVSGEFSTNPGEEISQQLQVGQPLMQQGGGMMGGQMSGMQPQGIQMPGMQGMNNMMGNPRSGMNAMRSNQGSSSFMQPHDPMSMLNALMQG